MFAMPPLNWNKSIYFEFQCGQGLDKLGASGPVGSWQSRPRHMDGGRAGKNAFKSYTSPLPVYPIPQVQKTPADDFNSLDRCSRTLAMTDSPIVRAPLDPREQPILDGILAVRDKLLLLKQDKSTYVKSQDVLPLYEDVIEHVHLLNDVRVEKKLEQNRGQATRTSPHGRRGS